MILKFTKKKAKSFCYAGFGKSHTTKKIYTEKKKLYANQFKQINIFESWTTMML